MILFCAINICRLLQSEGSLALHRFHFDSIQFTYLPSKQGRILQMFKVFSAHPAILQAHMLITLK